MVYPNVITIPGFKEQLLIFIHFPLDLCMREYPSPACLLATSHAYKHLFMFLLFKC